jgi:hypothetical protein
MMARYRLCGMTIESGLPLPELQRARGAPSYVIRRGRSGRVPRRPRWYHHWQEPDGTRLLSFGRVRSGYLLRFPALADFEIASDLSRVTARPRRELPPDTLRHLLLDQVWPLALSGRGHLVLHASAVVLPNGSALAFAGPAGSGKSSLAAAFAGAGARILTDDCLLVEPKGDRWHAVPSYPGLRLWPDMLLPLQAQARALRNVAHYMGKKRLDATALPFSSTAAPLAALYVLRRRGARQRLEAAALARATAVMELISFSYLLDHQDRAQLARSFTRLVALTASVPIFRLDLPHAPRRLHEAVALLNDRITG